MAIPVNITLYSVVVSPCLIVCRKELGSLRLKVHCSEQRILESSLYEPFVKLMLGAVDNPTVSVVHSGGGGSGGGGVNVAYSGGGVSLCYVA